MPGPADELLDTFLDEASEHLAALEQGLLNARDGTPDPEVMNALFRAAHSVKGGSGLFGFEPITRLTHALEQLLDRMRKGELPVTGERVDLMLRAVDGLGGLLASARAGTPFVPQEETLRELTAAAGVTKQSPVSKTTAPPPDASATYRVTIRPGRDLLANGTDPFLLIRNLGKKGELQSVMPSLDQLPALESLEPTHCYLAWDLTLESQTPIQELRDVFQFVENDCDVQITPLSSPASQPLEAIQQFASAIESLTTWLSEKLPALRLSISNTI